MQFLKALSNDESMSRTAVDKLTGYQENERNLITSELHNQGYIEYVNGEYQPNEQGEWIDTPGYYRITPAGRAFLEEKQRTDWKWIVTTTIASLAALFSILSYFKY